MKVVAGWVLCCSLAFADVIETKWGEVFEGRVIDESNGELHVMTFQGQEVIKSAEVVKRTKAETLFEQYESKLLKVTDSDKKGQSELARWCREKKLLELAAVHFKLAGEEKEITTLEADLKQRPYGLRVRAGVKQDLTAKELEALKPGVQAASDLLWRMTGGMMHLATFSIEDNIGDKPFQIIYDKDHVIGAHNPMKIGPSGWSNPQIFLHELCHGVLGLTDEYPTGENMKRVTCPGCIMAGRGAAFCDDSNHKGECKPCQQNLVGGFPNLKYGFERLRQHAAPGSPPPVKFVLKNQGR